MGTYTVTSAPAPWANPAFTVGAFQSFLEGRGMGRIAMLVGKYPDIVEPCLPKIHARLVDKGMLPGVQVAVGTRPTKLRRPGAAGEGVEYVGPRGAAAPSGELTDREAWTQLAGLVDEALGDQPAALREALKQAFLAEAAKAA